MRDELAPLGAWPGTDAFDLLAAESMNGAGTLPIVALTVEPWRDFRASGREPIPCLVEEFIPERAQGMLAAPPKAGKTWQGVGIGLGVATGTPVFGRFQVPRARPVLYVALEGHRAALAARIGCLARGLGLNPDADDLDHLHLAYKPRGINLADPSWALELLRTAERHGVALVIVDVLRRAAVIRENVAEDFMRLARNLDPLAGIGCASLLLHHFGKLTELRQERTPGERMSGSGAMFGALDVGIYITGTDNHGRRMRTEVDLRDLAAPPAFTVRLVGEGSGPNRSLEYGDTARLIHEADLPDEDKLKAPPSSIAAYVREAYPRRVFAKEIRDVFEISDDTLRRRRHDLETQGVRYVVAGKMSGYEPIPELLGQETIGGIQ